MHQEDQLIKPKIHGQDMDLSPIMSGIKVIGADTPGGTSVISKKEYTPILSFTPKQFQLELLETALRQNTVVCLQNSSEKCFLATMLLRELATESVWKPLAEGGKRSFFLVNSACFVTEYSTMIQIHTNLKAFECNKSKDVSSFDQERWQAELDRHHVAVLDSLVFLRLLDESHFSLDKVNLLVLDECHHVLDQTHPYFSIMQEVTRFPEGCRPRVLGLTASVLNGQPEPCALEEQINMLETLLLGQVQIATNTPGITRYGTKPREAVITCPRFTECTELVEVLSGILKEDLNMLDQFTYSMKARNLDGEFVESTRNPLLPVKQVLTECATALAEIGPLGVKILIPMLIKELLKIEKHEFLDVHLLFLQQATTQLRRMERICSHAMKDEGNPLNLKFVTPRVRKLLEILREFKPKEQSQEKTPQQSTRERAHKLASRRRVHRSHRAKWKPIIPESPTEGDLSGDEEDDDNDDEDEVDVQQQGSNSSAPTNLCGIVFIECRYTAAVINRLLKRLARRDSELSFLRCSCISIGSGRLGVAKRSPAQQLIQQRKHEETLKKFRRREINILIANSSSNEGVDLPPCNGCNLVICFDKPSQYQAYMQFKSKTRAPTSHYLMLVDEPELDSFLGDLQKFHQFERVLKRQSNKGQAQEETIDLSVLDQQMPPYAPKDEEESPRATMTSAIQIVNRYCAKLPSDVFTHLTPSCHVEERDEEGVQKFRVILKLPINSPVREPIKGPWMTNKKWASMAVAVKACKVLHQAGELNDNLQPMGKESVLRATANNFGHLFKDGRTRPATTKKRQYYDKQVAQCLKECVPTMSKPCYLYSIDMSLASPLPEILNIRERRLHRPEETERCFGILTSKPLPQVPGFPVYTRAGELAVAIVLQSDDVRLTQGEVDRAQLFHRCMFAEVLRLDKPNLDFLPQKSPANYVVIPLCKKSKSGPQVIDWSFLEKVSMSSGHLDQPPKLPDYSHNQYTFSPEVLADAVVTPIYRNIDQPQRYFVAEILHQLPVTSPFPSEKYQTFVDYYFERYDIPISNFQQPLVDVDCMSSRLNLLTPRYLNQKGKALPISTGQNKKGNLQKKQYLVPELCYIYPIPASLWRKAVCLPSILYRLNALLIAEELRVQVASEAGIGSVDLPVEYPYPNLSFGWEGLDLEALERQRKEEKEREEREKLERKSPDRLQNGKEREERNDSVLVEDFEGQKTEEVEEGAKVQIAIGADAIECKPKCNNEKQLMSDCSVSSEKHVDNECNVNNKCNAMGSEFDEKCDASKDVQFTEQLTTPPMRDESQPSSKACCNSTSETPLTSPSVVSELFNLDDNDSDPQQCLGPSPTILLQSLTMSNSSDGFNLERLEMLGDSFLKQAVTVYLYCSYPQFDEGKLSFLRSKQVSNYNLYGLGEKKALAQKMQVSLFDPSINWLPPCFLVKEGARQSAEGSPEDNVNTNQDAGFVIDTWDPSTVGDTGDYDDDDEEDDFGSDQGWNSDDFSEEEVDETKAECPDDFFAREEKADEEQWSFSVGDPDDVPGLTYTGNKKVQQDLGSIPQLPYEIHSQHSMSDKSIADCVEALIGCYLVSCGFRSALLFMSWMGLEILPPVDDEAKTEIIRLRTSEDAVCAASNPSTLVSNVYTSETPISKLFGHLKQPPSPLLRNIERSEEVLEQQLIGFDTFEENINYRFKDRAYLLQAFTHSSYHKNIVTDCYQRLEFLGDAILDYLITRHLYDHHDDLSPGALTDLRSALVNNTIFASLAVKNNFHKYLKAYTPNMFHVIDNFVMFVQEKKEALGMDSQLMYSELEVDQEESEDIEVPKALGDIFESIAGAVYLDSGMSLNAVWRVYYPLMKQQIEQYASDLPISPVRELLEMEPETARFGPPEKTIDGKTRVTVNVVGKGQFKGIGRNYHIAKATAARFALRHLKSQPKK